MELISTKTRSRHLGGVEKPDRSQTRSQTAEAVLPVTFDDIFVQIPDLRRCLLHNCEFESLRVMRQLCSAFVRDVPRVVNSKDWRLKHNYTGTYMARPDLVMELYARPSDAAFGQLLATSRFSTRFGPHGRWTRSKLDALSLYYWNSGMLQQHGPFAPLES